MNKLVLIADHDSGIRSLIAMVLKDAGYEIETASDGDEVLEAIERDEPDLILFDTELSFADGSSFIEHVRNLRSSLPPMVLVTTEMNARHLAREVGAVGWLRKPFDITDLVETVGKHIRKS